MSVGLLTLHMGSWGASCDVRPSFNLGRWSRLGFVLVGRVFGAGFIDLLSSASMITGRRVRGTCMSFMIRIKALDRSRPSCRGSVQELGLAHVRLSSSKSTPLCKRKRGYLRGDVCSGNGHFRRLQAKTSVSWGSTSQAIPADEQACVRVQPTCGPRIRELKSCYFDEGDSYSIFSGTNISARQGTHALSSGYEYF